MGHRDWADVALSQHLDELDATEALDKAEDALQLKIEAEFRAKLAAGDEHACAVLAEEFSGLSGNEIDKLLGDAATGGSKLRAWASTFIYSHTLDRAIRQVSGRAVPHRYEQEFCVGRQA